VRDNRPVANPVNLGHEWATDDVIIGGGNVTRLDTLPGCRAGDNALALPGGFLLWE
jgi:hypothetical protein